MKNSLEFPNNLLQACNKMFYVRVLKKPHKTPSSVYAKQSARMLFQHAGSSILHRGKMALIPRKANRLFLSIAIRSFQILA